MRSCALLFAILNVPLWGQMLVGSVQRIDKDQLQIRGRDGLVAFRADEHTTVAKLKKANDLSALVVGDEVRVNYYGETPFTAVNISAKVTISGTITQTATNHITVSRPSTDDAAQPEGKTGTFVFLNPATKLGVARDQLKVGRRVHVVGWDTGDGVVEAEKVVID
jgi:Domain of unknown function (DUF5666)